MTPHLSLNGLFANGMVVQHGQPIPVWGRGPEGESVQLRLGEEQIAATVTGGKWSANFSPRDIGKPLTLTVRCAGEECAVEDILVGEVFLCSGQSNMEVTLETLSSREEIIPAAENAQVRLFVQEKQPTAVPADQCHEGRWSHCTSASAPKLPALPLMFGLRIQRQLGVPVGVLVASVGGSGLTCWMPPAAFSAHDDLREYWEAYPREIPDYESIHAQWVAARAALEQENARRAEAKEEPLPWTKYLFFGPHGPKGLAQPAGFYHGMIHPLAPIPLRAVLWYQGETDAEFPSNYARNLRELIRGWRALWREPALPFFIVQLVRYSNAQIAVNWPFVREGQIAAAAPEDRAYLVPALDLGDPNDAHPADKELLAERLARFACCAVTSSPVPEAPRIIQVDAAAEGGLEVTLSRPVASGGAEISGFEIADTHGVFHAATATQVTPRRIRVELPPGYSEKPELRYLWSGAPVPSLFSEDGLLLLPFRTDNAPPPFEMADHYRSFWPNTP